MRYIILLLVLWSSGSFAFSSDAEIDKLDKALTASMHNGDLEKAEVLRKGILTRLNWLSKHKAEKFIIVNAEGQEMQLIDNGKVIIHEKVIVGRDGMETPEFDDEIKSVVFNPVWNIPPDLADTMLPKMKAVGGWNGYKVFVDGQIVSDISKVKVGSEYRIIQDPSEKNALGAIKFYMPNKYGVYLHDTSNRELFNESDRRFSAGCVRMQNASKLAAILLSSDIEAIHSIAEEQTTMEIPLDKAVPIYIVRWSVFVDKYGKIQYR